MSLTKTTANAFLQALYSRDKSIDVETILKMTIDKTGGLDGFCSILAECLTSGTPQIKGRALGILADLTKHFTDMKIKETVSIEDMNTRDLENVLHTSLIRKKKSGPKPAGTRTAGGGSGGIVAQEHGSSAPVRPAADGGAVPPLEGA